MDEDAPEIEPLGPPTSPGVEENRIPGSTLSSRQEARPRPRPIENVPDWGKTADQQPAGSSSSAYLTDEEKRKLLESMNKPFSNTPIVPPKPETSDELSPAPVHQPTEPHATSPVEPARQPSGSEPDMRPRRNAFFYKNIIQLSGNPRLAEHDEMTIGERVWVLRKKRIPMKTVSMVGISLAAVLIVVFALIMATGDSSGTGVIAGFVFDDSSRPYIHGAAVRFPELGKTYQSDGQGFFITDDLPTGNYRIEYLIDDAVVGVDYATIVEGEVTPLALRPSDEDELQEELAVTTESASSTVAVPQPKRIVKPEAREQTRSLTMKPLEDTRTTVAEQPQPRPPKPVEVKPTEARPTEARPTKVKSETARSGGATYAAADRPVEKPVEEPSAATPPAPAKLKLAANVDNARIQLGNDVLGAGNLTYSGITAGQYRYEISADGYEPLTGTVELAAGKVTVLEAELTRLPAAEKQVAYGAEDFYYSGVTAFNEGDFNAAISDLDEAIRRDPSYTEAYKARGNAYSSREFAQQAHDDYLRAAEILRFRKDYSSAISMYDKALKEIPGSVSAHLGRGSLFLTRGDELAAITDYESVIRADRGNFEGYLGLGKARFQQGNYAGAIEHFEDARSLNSDSPEVYQYLMLSYMADNDLKNVKKSYERFTRVANSRQINEMRSDAKYAAIMRIVDQSEL